MAGWDGFVDTGATKLLRTHISRMASYATKPPEDGRERDLRNHARAGGRFAEAWKRFVGNATDDVSSSVADTCCESCGKPLEAATRRRRFCEGTSACRVRATAHV